MPFTSATPTRRRDGCVSGMAFILYLHPLRLLQHDGLCARTRCYFLSHLH